MSAVEPEPPSAGVDPGAVAGRGGGWAPALGGVGPVGIAAIVVIVLSGNVGLPLGGAGVMLIPVGGLLVLAWRHWSRTPWREIGYVRPRSWLGGLLLGATLGVAFKLTMKAVVMPLLGADPINHAYHFLVGAPAVLPATALSMVFAAGFGEETVFRGFLFQRLGVLIGKGAWAKAAMILATSAAFAAEHLVDQGLTGAEQAAITGLVFGAVFALTGRIWTLMCAHAAFDLAAVAIIFLDLEARVAHAFVR